MVLTISQLQNNSKLLSTCGGKGRNLFLLSQLGFNVPNFVIIPTTTIQEILKEKKTQIDFLLKNEHIKDSNSTMEVARKIDQLLSDLKIKKEVLLEIVNQVKTEFKLANTFAVRSSVTSEDGAKYSFAGLFHTSLNVEIEQLELAILQGIRSLHHFNVLEYSRLQKIEPQTNNLALVIQEMVDASSSGIAFTMNPTGNFNDVLISCAFGCGEGVVNNTSEITNYLINRQNGLSFKEQTEAAVLTENQRKEILKSCLEIEKKMGAPQDIEFSFDKNSNLKILQSRPITTIDLHNLKIVDNTNIVESYPGITMPLTFSFARNGYQQVFTGAARLFNVSESKIKEIEPQLSNMITHVHGRIYYNLHNWYKLMQMVIASQNSMQAWETLIGVKMKSQQFSAFSVFKKIKTVFTSLSLFIRFNKIVRNFYANFELEYLKLRQYTDALNKNKPSVFEVFTFYIQMSDRLFKHWAPTLLNDFFTFKFYDLLNKMIASYGFSKEETITNDLLCGMPGVESEMLIVELLKLKEKIISDKALSLLFCKSNTTILSEMPLAFKTDLNQFVAKYGDRTLEELKLETPNFRMNPEALIDLLKSQLHNQNTPETLAKKQLQIRLAAEIRVKERQKKFALKNLLYKFILKHTRATITNRENMRIRRTRSYGAVKELFAYIAEEMVEKQVIDKKTDVFYLSVEQLSDYCLLGKTEQLKTFIANKKQEFTLFETDFLPDRMVFNGDFPPVRSVRQMSATYSNILFGTSISKGMLSGETIVLEKPDYTQSVEGKILVTRMTDPAWVFLMTRAAGLISEKGSPLSHTAIVGRELGIPVLIGVDNATTLLPSGTTILMNCNEGFVEIKNGKN
jgi:pyruvate,water dikinase